MKFINLRGAFLVIPFLLSLSCIAYTGEEDNASQIRVYIDKCMQALPEADDDGNDSQGRGMAEIVVRVNSLFPVEESNFIVENPEPDSPEYNEIRDLYDQYSGSQLCYEHAIFEVIYPDLKPGDYIVDLFFSDPSGNMFDSKHLVIDAFSPDLPGIVYCIFWPSKQRATCQDLSGSDIF